MESGPLESNREREGGQARVFKVAWQSSLVLAFPVLFWVLSSLSPWTSTPDRLSWAGGAVILLALWIPAVALTFRGLRNHPISLRHLIQDNPQLWVVALYGILAAHDIGVIPMCDSGAYFRMILEAVQEFNFSPGDSLAAMQLAGHPAQAYAAYMMLGQFLGFGNYSIGNLQTYILHAAEILAFAGITGRLFPGRDRRWERLLATSLFAFTPLVYGLSLTVSPDFAVLAFFCLVIWAALRNYRILAVAFGIMLCFSKEFGALLYAGLVMSTFGVLVPFEALRSVAPRSRALAMTVKKQAPLLIPLALYALYLALGGGVWRLGGVQEAASSAHLFRLEPWTMWDKTIQLFLANFNWVIWWLVGASLLLALMRRLRKARRPLPASGHEIWFVVLGVAIIPFLAANYLFVTWNNARYILPMCLIAVLFLVRALESSVRPMGVRMGALAVCLALFGGSCVRTFDPLLLRVFPTFRFGERQMSFYNSGRTICDLTFYNREYVHYNRLFDHFLAEGAYDPREDEFIFFTGGEWWGMANHNIEYLWTGGQLLGPMYVGPGTLRRSFVSTGNVRLRSTIFVRGASDPSILPAHAYCIEPFWIRELHDLSISEMKDYYHIVREIRVEEDGYSLVGYELVRRE